ncbi:signal peptide protein [Rhodopirellula sallentina SM41]|uniref:Signal peptide protein n=1 Tax=Rhodopirellula sallentina SM41 TaxID=1263870 RepID=M5TX94_9BACT|nr:signal peptide protein [Rhodopirellula sallentina SM41]
MLAYPTRYVRWWLLAVRRGMWGSAANMVMHPLFLISIIAFAVFSIYQCVSPSVQPDDQNPSSRCDAGYRALVLLAITYAAFKLGFVALTSPPIGRFSDAAFVFIPGILLCAALAIVQQIRQSTQSTLKF